MIEVKNLTKRFGDHTLYENLNFTINDRDFIIISGESGKGKTTLLNMIGSLEKPTSGQIIIDGLDVSKRQNQKKLFSDKIGFLFQNFVLMEDKTVEQNLRIIKNRDSSNITIMEALKKVGLADKLKSKVYTLSGGEQQRIALARLMIKKCDIVLADEPTGSLDRKNADIVFHLLKELNNMGKTVIIVSHDQELLNKGLKTIML